MSNLKGRATALFQVVSEVVDGIVTITVTAEAVKDLGVSSETVRGTVALGTYVAGLGKVATPLSASDTRFNLKVAKLQEQFGISEDAAIEYQLESDSV